MPESRRRVEKEAGGVPEGATGGGNGPEKATSILITMT